MISEPACPKVLLIDDEVSFATTLVAALADAFVVTPVIDGRAAMERLYRETFDLILLDMRLPELGGLELLRIFRQRYTETPILMLTGNSDSRSIIESMKAGAVDYIIKGEQDFEAELRIRMQQAIERARLVGKNRRLEAKVVHQAKSYELVGHSLPMLKLKSQLLALKSHTASVLITGESGVGKELVARGLNLQEDNSAERPFIEVNCAAFPENLIESELFGHEKGAFTGAVNRHEGKFVAASGGEIFLDEIGELPLLMQAKLLRVLQEKRVTPVGSTKSIPVDVRIISATNRDLREEVHMGRFREDLYYRISVICLSVPTLAERNDDIPVLVDYFLNQFGGSQARISHAAMEALQAYPWPGNIRALRNCLERAWITAQSPGGKATIQPEHLHFDNTTFGRGPALRVPSSLLPHALEEVSAEGHREFVEWAEKAYYESAYGLVGQNKSRLAEKLSLSRDFIHRKLKTLGISKPEAECVL